MDLIRKILFEATYEKDSGRDEIIKSIINKIEGEFYNYDGTNTPNFQVNKNDGMAFYKANGLSVMFYDKNHPAKIRKAATYDKNNSMITISGCTINWNNETNRWNYFDLEKDSLYHELVHYFDYQNIDNDNYEKIKIKDKNNFTKKEYSKYLNHGTEFNAHFMQYVMPIVIDIKNYKKKLGIETFGQFKKEIMGSGRVKNFYELLNDKMKKHFIKRLTEYYQEIFKNKN